MSPNSTTTHAPAAHAAPHPAPHAEHHGRPSAEAGGHGEGQPPTSRSMSTKELLIFVVALFFVWSIGVAEGVVIHILYQIGGTYTARIDELEKKIEQCKAASQASALTPMPAPAPAPAPAQTNSGSAIDSVSGQ